MGVERGDEDPDGSGRSGSLWSDASPARDPAADALVEATSQGPPGAAGAPPAAVAGGWSMPKPPPRLPRPADAGGSGLTQFVPLDGRARLARVSLILVAVVALAVAISDTLELRLLDRLEAGALVTEAELTGNDLRQGIVALLALGTYVFAAVAFIRWMNLAYRGLDALGAGRRYHTGWSIGGWFVPILNLWRPKQIVNDLWAAGEPRQEPGGQPLLLAWWAMFLISGVIGNLVMRRVLSDDGSIESLRSLNEADRLASVADIVGVVLALVVVREITTRLHRRAGLPEA